MIILGNGGIVYMCPTPLVLTLPYIHCLMTQAEPDAVPEYARQRQAMPVASGYSFGISVQPLKLISFNSSLFVNSSVIRLTPKLICSCSAKSILMLVAYFIDHL